LKNSFATVLNFEVKLLQEAIEFSEAFQKKQ